MYDLLMYWSVLYYFIHVNILVYLIYNNLKFFVYICLCTPVCGFPQRPEEGAESLGAEVTGRYEYPNMGAEN